MPIYGIIYLLINQINRKMYVGQTVNWVQRMSSHKKSKEQDHLHRSIRKYGWNNFEKIKLDVCYTHKQDLDELEKYYIEKFQTIEYGYNKKEGGANGRPSSESINKTAKANTKPVEEIIERLKEIHGETVTLDINTYKNTSTKARFLDKDYGEWWTVPYAVLSGGRHNKRADVMRRTNMSKTMKLHYKEHPEAVKEKKEQLSGQNHPMFSKHHSSESILKIKQNSTVSRAVVCIETQQVFLSIKAASRETGVPETTLSRHLNDGTSTFRNLSFAFIKNSKQDKIS